MKQISGKRFVTLLEQRGWTLLRVRGSHHVYGKAGHPAHISVPIHGNHPLKEGLLRHFLKVAGISQDEL